MCMRVCVCKDTYVCVWVSHCYDFLNASQRVDIEPRAPTLLTPHAVKLTGVRDKVGGEGGEVFVERVRREPGDLRVPNLSGQTGGG